MIDYRGFETLLSSLRVRYGYAEDGHQDPVQNGDPKATFDFLVELLRKYPNCKSDVHRLAHLGFIVVVCQKYAAACHGYGATDHYAPRYFAVLDVSKEAKAEIRKLTPRSRARDNFLKLLPKGLANNLATPPEQRAQAQASWDMLQGNVLKLGSGKAVTMTPQDKANVQAAWDKMSKDQKQKYWSQLDGKKVNQSNWLEIFDPKHRPHYINFYDMTLNGWVKLASPFWDGTKDDGHTPNPNYDPSFRASLFDDLDGFKVFGDYQYKYLEDKIEREAYRVVVKGDVLWRGGQPFSTRGWELNNGFRTDHGLEIDHGIWVISTVGEIYSGPQKGGGEAMHHSGFLAGTAVRAAGEWKVLDGKLKIITGSSGHYTPNFKQFQDGLRTLLEAGINLKTVAAEWPCPDESDLRWFNAAQLVQPGVKAQWPVRGRPVSEIWPKFVGRPLREVSFTNPTNCKPSLPADEGVDGPPFDPPSGAGTATPPAAPQRLRPGIWPDKPDKIT